MKAPVGPRLVSRSFLFIAGFTRAMTLGGRAILHDGERVLLVRHGYMPGWQFPGGGIAPGETIEAGARREVLEETGYRVMGKAQLIGVYLNRAASRRDHVGLFLCPEFTRERAFRPGFEIAECTWFSLSALPPDIGAGTARRLSEVFGGAEKAGEW